MTGDVSSPAAADPLDRLTAFSGTPDEFWPECFAYWAGLVRGRAGLVAQRGPEGAWAQIAAWPAFGADAEPGPREALRRAAADAAEAVFAQGALALECRVEGFRGGGTLMGVRLPLGEGASPTVLFLRSGDKIATEEAASLLRLLRHAAVLPTAFQERVRQRRAEAETLRFGSVLDLLATLRGETRFISASMRFCNELAGRYGCDRVSLGWLKGDYVRLVAVSHAESFEKRMDAVRRVETAMEEALDQDEEIVWPVSGDGPVVREHEALAREQGARHVVSIPIRHGGRPVGVVTCERAQPFGDLDLAHLRLILDQIAPGLAGLEEKDVAWMKRGKRWARRMLQRALQPRYAGIRLLSIVGAFALLLFLFLPVPFRVQTPFVVRAKNAAYLPAPFEGYLAEVGVEPGDRVVAGQPLLRLDTRELLLEEAAAQADRERFLREGEKARAGNELAAMRIALAQAEQSRVRLELMRFRLAQAALVAPFDGVIIEGDLRDRIGAPVKQGDTLLRIARLDALDVEIEVDQRDAHEVRSGAKVRLAFAGRPGLRVRAEVAQVEPQAQTRERRNFFPARCSLAEPPADWMRPGMTGLGKVSAGWRSPAWIVLRRTTDFIRLHVWL